MGSSPWWLAIVEALLGTAAGATVAPLIIWREHVRDRRRRARAAAQACADARDHLEAFVNEHKFIDESDPADIPYLAIATEFSSLYKQFVLGENPLFRSLPDLIADCSDLTQQARMEECRQDIVKTLDCARWPENRSMPLMASGPDQQWYRSQAENAKQRYQQCCKSLTDLKNALENAYHLSKGRSKILN